MLDFKVKPPFYYFEKTKRSKGPLMQAYFFLFKGN